MEQLQITVLKRSHDFNQTINIWVLSPKHIFKTSRNGLLVLRPMVHVTCFFLKYQTGAIVDHNFEINHMIVVKLFFFQRKIFTAVVQMSFQGFSEWLLQFKTYDTRCLHFCQISNWSNCRSQFGSDQVTLLKLLIFLK